MLALNKAFFGDCLHGMELKLVQDDFWHNFGRIVDEANGSAVSVE